MEWLNGRPSAFDKACLVVMADPDADESDDGDNQMFKIDKEETQKRLDGFEVGVTARWLNQCFDLLHNVYTFQYEADFMKLASGKNHFNTLMPDKSKRKEMPLVDAYCEFLEVFITARATTINNVSGTMRPIIPSL